MVDLQDVIIDELVTAERQNLINEYIQHGTHKINTKSIDVGGIEVITINRDGIVNNLTIGNLSGILKATNGLVSITNLSEDILHSNLGNLDFDSSGHTGFQPESQNFLFEQSDWQQQNDLFYLNIQHNFDTLTPIINISNGDMVHEQEIIDKNSIRVWVTHTFDGYLKVNK